MARNMYGATSADFTLTSGGRVVPGAALTIWSARTGGARITDLLDVNSVACTTITSAADGSVVYYGPNNDKTVHWADSGQGARVAIRPVDITGDPPALSIGTVGTGTAGATLTGTSEAPVLNLVLPSAGANGVNTAAIQDKAVTAAKIADDTITAAQIAANAVGASELADNAVDTNAIADSAVTSAKIADGTIVAGDVAASTFAAFGTVGNLLTANQASVETDTTGFAVNANCTISRSTAQALSGSASLSMTAIATNTMSAISGSVGSVRTAVTPGQTYTATVSFRAATTGRACSVRLAFYTATGSFDSWVIGTNVTDTTSGWVTGYASGVAPATAVFADVVAFFNTAGAGEVHYADCFGLWKGAGGQWAMPGTPIPGLSRIAVNNAVDLSGTGTPEGVVTAAPGSTWLQTDATTDVKGWIRWVKSTGTGNTGWVAGPEADTGIRNLAAESLANSWAVSGSLFKLSRVGRTVDIDATFTKASASSDTVYTLPAGFRPQQATVARVCRTDTADDFVTVSITSAGVITIPRSSMASNVVYVSLSFVCPTTAPTSLPGS